VSEPSHAVFLSYASQDSDAAARICTALRAAGIEVWFDQSELRGGDAWDQSIRKQIKTCALFVPVISRNTHKRDEGYFRLEWRLAVDRTLLMTGNRAFLLPVVIDDRGDDDEQVPEKFREVQWTRLPAGETSPAFVERVRRLLSPESSAATPMPGRSSTAAANPRSDPGLPLWRSQQVRLATMALLILGALVYVGAKYWTPKQTAPKAAVAENAPTFSPPPHSIAVLPFVNMSADKEQEYFSDGLSEELLNSLSRINELQVAARTSSFYFKGEHVDMGTIARKLNVASILEGSVRRSGHTVRITVQLSNAVTGYHLWSQTYDRDLRDILKLQTEIATSVADALKITLLGDLAARIELGGTHNPAAFDAYARALKLHYMVMMPRDEQAAIDGFTQAIRLDPHYALAYAGRSLALSSSAAFWPASAPAISQSIDRALVDAHKSIALAPDIGDGHLALASAYEASLDFERTGDEYERALALAPGNARILRDYGYFATLMGRSNFGITMLRRAATLDPLNYSSHLFLGNGLQSARRYHDAIGAYRSALAILSDASDARTQLGVTQYLIGDFEAARLSCESTAKDYDFRQQCMAMVYHKLSRRTDAEAALAELKVHLSDSGPTTYAEVYAQWGEINKALEWVDTALRLRNPGLEGFKTDPLMDPLRNEPRFQAVMRALKFPD
jgi:TolB-like protein/Tfp pilus assembly protein PilF